jgi:hypothetical protein
MPENKITQIIGKYCKYPEKKKEILTINWKELAVINHNGINNESFLNEIKNLKDPNWKKFFNKINIEYSALGYLLLTDVLTQDGKDALFLEKWGEVVLTTREELLDFINVNTSPKNKITQVIGEYYTYPDKSEKIFTIQGIQGNLAIVNYNPQRNKDHSFFLFMKNLVGPDWVKIFDEIDVGISIVNEEEGEY